MTLRMRRTANLGQIRCLARSEPGPRQLITSRLSRATCLTTFSAAKPTGTRHLPSFEGLHEGAALQGVTVTAVSRTLFDGVVSQPPNVYAWKQPRVRSRAGTLHRISTNTDVVVDFGLHMLHLGGSFLKTSHSHAKTATLQLVHDISICTYCNISKDTTEEARRVLTVRHASQTRYLVQVTIECTP